LADGRECISDATFNGINSTLLAKPKFTNANATDIKVMFRSRSNGTLLQIVSAIDDKFIRLTLEDNQIRVDVPEKDNEMHNYTVSINNEDGRWHTITVRFDKDEVAAYIDDKVDMIKILTIDSTVNNLSEFVEGSKAVIVGSSLESKGQNLAYNLESAEDTTLASEVVDIFSESWETQYRGCMQELRIAGVLVPFFTPEQLGVNKPSYRFDIETVDMVETAVSGCTLCYEHECQNGASCAQPQELYECACQKGYEGETCAVNTDECTFHQCENGICLDGVANYTCECETGWTGWLCNEDFDECTDKPCLNDGICTQTDEPGNYTCECTEQYRGHNCEQLKNRTCEDNPCRNNAVCQNMKNNVNNEAYSCDCEPLYEGVDCQDKRDFCKESWDPCKNGATCTSLDSVLTYSCKCQPGYTGDTCEDQINECEVNGNPCNGGQCIDKLNEYSCNCNDTGFSGDHCQFDINECEKFTPCQNGNCENTNGGYFCECDEDFCGTNCQRQNPCTTIQGLCKNEGQCKESCDEPAPYYDCVCTEEWEGRNCTIKKWSAPTGNLPPNPVFDGLLKIVAPVVAGLLVLGLGCLVCLVIMVRKKRSGHGTYNPQKQEINGHRFEMTEMEVLKMPNEERLI
jgi:protein crumbs